MTSFSRLVTGFDPTAEFVPPAEWSQGRTVYGGLSSALAFHAAKRSAPRDLPPLKSAQICFVGAASGSLRFTTQLLRQGKSATAIAVDCLSGSDIALRATFLCAAPRSNPVTHDYAPPPSVAAADSCRRFAFPAAAPAFIANFDVRFVGSSLPVSGSDKAELLAWVRHHDATGIDPAVALIGLADCLPPAAMATFSDFVPVSSMLWTFDLPQPAKAGQWHLLRSTSVKAQDGYSFQTMEIWDEGGTLILSGSQTVAIFG